MTSTPGHPPFDPELIPALKEAHQEAPVTLTPENLAECRQAELDATLTLEFLAEGGIEVEERLVPGAGRGTGHLAAHRPPAGPRAARCPGCSTPTAAGS